MRFGLQLHTNTVTDAVVAATEAEEFGFDVVLVADHVGRDWSPLLTLAAVAAATSRIRVGTFVLNACLHHPVMLAREIATLDQISGGRVELGLGAGHTPAEFAATGTPFASAAARKAQLAEFVEVIRRLLDGETVDHDGEQFVLRAASVRPPVQARVPILVGGSGAGLLGHAGRHADIVGLTGLGRT
ncbi:MAG: LLM class flavin-dependent oxidoreductase, partial [Actinomycetota bacterium]|nr:LLM class flavin-dependent oxidoreductase [Actinomycetota bacterium]